jgi:hypothetical protein
LTGKSGSQYKFNAYPLETVFKKGLAAVYLVTRRVHVKPSGAVKHKEICLGQTDDLRQPITGQGEFVTSQGANCICVHGEKDQVRRLGIHQDLLDRHRAVDRPADAAS